MLNSCLVSLDLVISFLVVLTALFEFLTEHFISSLLFFGLLFYSFFILCHAENSLACNVLHVYTNWDRSRLCLWWFCKFTCVTSLRFFFQFLIIFFDK